MRKNRLPPSLSPAARAFAAADLAPLARRFALAGCGVNIPARGILQLTPPGSMGRRLRLLLSAGVHGDETAPIEMLALMLDKLANEPHAMALELMIVIGDPQAIAAGKRFIDMDMNRLFGTWPDGSRSTVEARRADEIMQAVAVFFADADTEKWHFDLHTAIRDSHYPTFAVVPEIASATHMRTMVSWLGRAGIGAAIVNPHPTGTFSAYTATGWGAVSATVELGRIGALGSNDPTRFNATRDALDTFIRRGNVPGGAHLPDTFTVAQELIKHSDAFRMAFDSKVKNFTAMAPGALIATDGEVEYRAGPLTEYVVFPNPDVQIGLRAGLMVVRDA